MSRCAACWPSRARVAFVPTRRLARRGGARSRRSGCSAGGASAWWLAALASRSRSCCWSCWTSRCSRPRATSSVEREASGRRVGVGDDGASSLPRALALGPPARRHAVRCAAGSARRRQRVPPTSARTRGARQRSSCRSRVERASHAARPQLGDVALRVRTPLGLVARTLRYALDDRVARRAVARRRAALPLARRASPARCGRRARHAAPRRRAHLRPAARLRRRRRSAPHRLEGHGAPRPPDHARVHDRAVADGVPAGRRRPVDDAARRRVPALRVRALGGARAGRRRQHARAIASARWCSTTSCARSCRRSAARRRSRRCAPRSSPCSRRSSSRTTRRRSARSPQRQRKRALIVLFTDVIDAAGGARAARPT